MKRVLVVDDSVTARMFTRRCLEIAGLAGSEFVEAEDGAKALEALGANGADLVVTDLIMPNVDGGSLLKRLKSHPRFSGIPVIVVTSAGNPAKEEELMKMGALAVLHKPVVPAKLAEVLAGISMA